VRKILIIEDSRMISKLLQEKLEAKGFECEAAVDGLEGFNMAKRIVPDLIILDVMLPTMNGFKICRLLKFDRRYKRIPIIMLTTRRETSDKETGISTGADSYMTKPFEMDELIGEIYRLLGTEAEMETQV
jgi:DNA-binding response OmpR family regulator